jgi:hypothetical protein
MKRTRKRGIAKPKDRKRLERRFARNEFVPIIVRTKVGDITIRIGRLANGNFLIDTPRHCCDVILPDKRPCKTP